MSYHRGGNSQNDNNDGRDSTMSASPPKAMRTTTATPSSQERPSPAPPPMRGFNNQSLTPSQTPNTRPSSVNTAPPRYQRGQPRQTRPATAPPGFNMHPPPAFGYGSTSANKRNFNNRSKSVISSHHQQTQRQQFGHYTRSFSKQKEMSLDADDNTGNA